MGEKKRNIVVFVIAAFFVVNLFFLGYFNFFLDQGIAENKLKVIFLDVGQGDAILLQSAQGLNVLIDGGPDREIIYKLDRYIPFYNRRIDLIISTHFDYDHFAGLIEVLKRYKVKKIISNGFEESEPLFREWNKLIEQKKIPSEKSDDSLSIFLNKDLVLDFLWPDINTESGIEMDDNFYSIVFQLKHQNNKFLFMADVPVEAEIELMNKKENLKSDVIKIAHHGSKYSSSLEFLRSVEPKYAVISVGKNSFGHPSLRVIKNLENIGAEILRTDEKGDIIFISDGQNLDLTFKK